MALLKFKTTINDENRTLFKYLVKQLNNVPISRIEKLFRLKDVKVNGIRTNQKDYKIKRFDLIEVYGLEDHKVDKVVNSTPISFKKIFEDKNILIVEKPINVAVHGDENCLDNQVLSYLKYNQNDSFCPSHVGRLDKATSGLMIYAKTYNALVELNAKTNSFEKYYVLKSDFDWTKKKVVLYSHYNHKLNKWFANEQPKGGEKMETIFFQDGNKKYAQILSGKKHQIRLTLQYLGFPIYGDNKYGGKPDKRLYLHCCKLVFQNLENGLDYLNGTGFVSDIKW